MEGAGLSVERFALNGLARQTHNDAAAHERFDDPHRDSLRPLAESKAKRRVAARIDFDDFLSGANASTASR